MSYRVNLPNEEKAYFTLHEDRTIVIAPNPDKSDMIVVGFPGISSYVWLHRDEIAHLNRLVNG